MFLLIFLDRDTQAIVNANGISLVGGIESINHPRLERLDGANNDQWSRGHRRLYYGMTEINQQIINAPSRPFGAL